MAALSGDETAPFFGFLGAAAALVFSGMGAAYGTTKSGVGVASMGVMRPELVMKSIVPVVTAMLEFDNGQHMKLPYNRASLGPIGLSANSTWEGSFDFKLGHMKGPLKSAKGDNEGQVLSALVYQMHCPHSNMDRAGSCHLGAIVHRYSIKAHEIR